MSDPAIEAAQRAFGDDVVEVDLYRHQPVLSMNDGSIKGCQCSDDVFYKSHEDWGTHLAEVCAVHMANAAREALKPLRESMNVLRETYVGTCGVMSPGVNRVLEELEPLAFATEELAR